METLFARKPLQNKALTYYNIDVVVYSTVPFLILIAHRCDLPLGMEDGRIADHQITASSNYTWRGVASRGRLGIKASNGYYGAWVASTSWGWLQIDLGDVAMVTKVATQGRQDAGQWVTRYYLYYSIDGIHWVSLRNMHSIGEVCTLER